MEIWKPVKNYEGSYKVSNYGRVKSLPKLRRQNEKILKIQSMKSGYSYVDLGNGKSIKRKLVHRLVAEAFIENKKAKKQVNHIDGNKNNNNLNNLEWVTASENQKHSVLIGLKSAKGTKNSQVKLTEKEVLEIRELISRGELKQVEIAKKYGVSHITISDIKRKRSWSHI